MFERAPACSSRMPQTAWRGYRVDGHGSKRRPCVSATLQSPHTKQPSCLSAAAQQETPGLCRTFAQCDKLAYIVSVAAQASCHCSQAGWCSLWTAESSVPAWPVVVAANFRGSCPSQCPQMESATGQRLVAWCPFQCITAYCCVCRVKWWRTLLTSLVSDWSAPSRPISLA